MSVLTHAGASATLMGLGALPVVLGIGSFADPDIFFAQAGAIAGAGFALAAAGRSLDGLLRARRPATVVMRAEASPADKLALETMIRVVQADGRIEADETRLIRDSIFGLTEVRLAETDILREADALRGSTVGFLARLGDLRYELSDGERETVIKASYLAMMADGAIADEEGWIVDQVYAALMPHRKLEEIIADLDPWLH